MTAIDLASLPCAAEKSAQLPASRERWYVAILAATIACATCITFLPATRFEFVSYDDPHYIYQNPAVQRGLSSEGVRWAFTTGQAGNYHPLTWLSLMLDRSLLGESPAGFHRTNIAFHTANCVLLLLVLRGMTGSTWRSAAVALVWGLHPLRAESVAWATERKDVLAGFFGLLALAAYVRYARQPSWRRYAIILAAFELCLLSKSTWVTLPAVLLLLDAWPLRRIDPSTWRARVCEKLPLLGLSLIACAATLMMQSRGAAIGNLEKYPFSARLGNAVVAYAAYLGKMVWPVDLAVFYPYSPVGGGAFLLAAVIVLAMTVLAIWWAKRSAAVLVGWLWFLGAMVPMIGLVQSGAQSMADRFTYLPMIGLLVGIAFSLPAAWADGPRRRWAAGGAVALLCFALMLTTRQQLVHWRDSTALFERALAVTADNHVAHNSLAYEHLQAGRLDLAKHHYEAALRIKPGFGSALNGLGVVLGRQGDLQGAIAQYERAIEADSTNAMAHRNLATCLLEIPRREEEGFRFLLRAVELEPRNPRSNTALGIELARRGNAGAAVGHFERAVQAERSNADALVYLGRALLDAGRPSEALVQFQQVLRLQPASPEAHFFSGMAWAHLGRLDHAERHLRECLALAPADTVAQEALRELVSRRRESATIDLNP